LARAIVIDQLWPRAGAIGGSDKPSGNATSAEHAALVVSTYQAAAAFEEVRDEALMRLAWFEHRTGRSADAVVRLGGAAAIDARDAQLGYLRELMLGHALTTTGRTDEALSAFRRAVALLPGAQSARVALMNTLIVRGERAEADAIAEALQAAPSTVIDPWWTYWQGDYRRYPQALRAAREMAR
jgi:Flp pilus assembly protein TadD